MTLLGRLLRRDPARVPKADLKSLYETIVARARAPHWYVEGEVPDTLDGRFDMIAAVLSVVLIRFEQLNTVEEGVRLTEIFVDDMDGQLRQIGIGDLIVGKQIGKMMSALGGRLTAYRAAFASGEHLEDALRRNLYRGEPVADDAVAYVADQLQAFATRIGALDRDALVAFVQRD